APLAAAPLLLCLACSSDRPAPGGPTRAEGTEPSKYEKLVEAFLAAKAKGRAEVTVTHWGPHDLWGRGRLSSVHALATLKPGAEWMGLDESPGPTNCRLSCSRSPESGS